MSGTGDKWSIISTIEYGRLVSFYDTYPNMRKPGPLTLLAYRRSLSSEHVTRLPRNRAAHAVRKVRVYVR